MKKFLCIVTATAMMLMGCVSAPMTAKADGYELDPCPYCHDGLVWRSETPYQVMVGSRTCIHPKSSNEYDYHFQNRVHVLLECRDCGRLVEDKTVLAADFWICGEK